MRKVIIDVDTGIDDALAIILALNSKELDILGFATVSGNVSSKTAELNTRRILKLYNREDIGVYIGASSPLIRKIDYKNFIHGEHGLAGQLTNVLLPRENRIHASDYIIKSVNENEEVSLIMLGPLTNLALALKKEPTIVDKIKEVVIMGGAIKVEGNITPLSEFNIYTDPESAEIVLSSGLNINLIPLDITQRAIMRKDILKSLDKSKDRERFIYNILNHYLNLFEDRIDGGICAIHDPLALSYLINPKIFTMDRVYVGVESKSRYCDGKTILFPYDRYKIEANVNLAVDINLIKFLDMFINRVIR